MVKTLRYTLMAVVAMVANFSFAQTTIDFTKQAAKLKDKVATRLQQRATPSKLTRLPARQFLHRTPHQRTFVTTPRTR